MSRYVSAMTTKRPLLPQEDRNRLRGLAGNAQRHIEETGGSSAYARAVIDTLRWIVGDDTDMTPMLQEVTRQ